MNLFDYDRPSEYLCDGDKADDKEIYDAADPDDIIVEDFGFSGSRNARGQVRMSFVQLDSELNSEIEGKPEQEEYAAHRVGKDWALIQ